MIWRLLIARTRCHSTCLSGPTSSFRVKRQSQPNPLGLSSMPSVGYPKNGNSQTHFPYLACFQDLSLGKRPFFSKRIVQRPENRCLSCDRHSVSCWPTRHVVTRWRGRSENIPTVQAGISREMSRLHDKSHPQISQITQITHGTSLACKLVGYSSLPERALGRLETEHCSPARGNDVFISKALSLK